MHPAAKGPSTAEAIKQLEHDWTDAEIAGDVEKLGQILADGWMGLSYDGKRETKQAVLADLKSGKSKLRLVDKPRTPKPGVRVTLIQLANAKRVEVGRLDFFQPPQQLLQLVGDAEEASGERVCPPRGHLHDQLRGLLSGHVPPLVK